MYCVIVCDRTCLTSEFVCRAPGYLQPTRVTHVPISGQRMDAKRSNTTDHIASPMDVSEALEKEQKKQQKLEAAR